MIGFLFTWWLRINQNQGFRRALAEIDRDQVNREMDAAEALVQYEKNVGN